MRPFHTCHGLGDANDLHTAILSKATERAEVLISRGSKEYVNKTDSVGSTPLIYASWSGPSRLVAMLLQRGADTGTVNGSGYNALHASAMRGDAESTLLLVQAGADLLFTDSHHGATALHMAAQVGHVNVMEVLVQAGADVDQRSSEGATAIYMAASRGETRAVEFLLLSKASAVLSCAKFTPLEAAAKLEYAGVVRTLLQHVGINGCDGGRNALVYAAQQQNVEIMTLLSNAGAVDFVSDALRSSVLFGREISVKFLLRACSPKWVSVYVNIRDPNGLSPLGCSFNKRSLRLNSCRIVRMLCDAGADTSRYEKITSSYTESDLWNVGHAMTEEQRIGFQEICRLLQRLPACRALSWGWPSSTSSTMKKKKNKKVHPFSWSKSNGTPVLTRALYRYI